MKREDFIKFIPKPRNEDVILYDISLNNLIDIDVVQEYEKLYPIFINEKSKFEKLKKEIELYKKSIDEVYLYNPSWSEEDYLNKLRNDKKTYSILYSNIKKGETNIEILQKKVTAINEKIQIQIAKENRERESKYENINKDIENNKEKLDMFKDSVNIYKHTLKRIDEQIKEIKEDLKLFKLSEERLKKGNYECICCGKKLRKNDDSSIIFQRLQNNALQRKIELKELTEKRVKIETNLAYYESELSKVKTQLNSNIIFKKEHKNTYIKKSLEVLKLEAIRDEMLNKITQIKHEINEDSNINSKKFIELKNRIEIYENSLENLKKIKNIKQELKEKMDNFQQIEDNFNKITKTIQQYVSFLTIYYKIYEQKASNYCGPDYKFKFFRVENYKIIDIFEIYYKGTEYTQLSKEEIEIVDKNLIEKFSIYF